MNTIKFEYHFKMWQFASNALIKLYSEIRVSEKHIPVHQRNKILLSYLNATAKGGDPNWGLIKADLKILIASGKKRNANLEQKVNDLSERATGYLRNHTDRLFDLFSYLETAHQFDSKLLDPDSPKIPKCIYTEELALAETLDAGNKIEKLDLFILPGHTEQLVEAINQSWIFTCDIPDGEQHRDIVKIALYPAA